LIQKPIPVLMYHRINKPDSASSLVVSPGSFVRQIDWLEKKAFHFLSLDEVVDQGAKTALWKRYAALTFDDGFRDNYEKGFSHLLRRGKKAALFVVVDWVGQNGFLNWREIRELAEAGMTIASHSLSHRWLPDLTEDRELEREVSESKKRIEDQIGREVRYFSYPVGGVDERVGEAVQKAGYRAAWVAAARPTRSVKNELFSLRRVKISPSDAHLGRFALKAWGLKGLF